MVIIREKREIKKGIREGQYGEYVKGDLEGRNNGPLD